MLMNWCIVNVDMLLNWYCLNTLDNNWLLNHLVMMVMLMEITMLVNMTSLLHHTSCGCI